MRGRILPEQYLSLLRRLGITPNWWCSAEYFDKAGFVAFEDPSDMSYRVLDKYRQQIFPTIIDKPPYDIWGDNPDGYWCDFIDTPYSQGQKFLDWEYIYRPEDFFKMEGKKWGVFRKNARKFPQRIGETLWYTRLNEIPDESLLEEWSGKVEEIQDGRVMIDYFFSGKNRAGLYGRTTKKLYGLNIWDHNYKYINFRYSICRNIPFLAEYLRSLFYTHICENDPVNDGGVLGRESLKKFKDKMNPIMVRQVFGKERK